MKQTKYVYENHFLTLQKQLKNQVFNEITYNSIPFGSTLDNLQINKQSCFNLFKSFNIVMFGTELSKRNKFSISFVNGYIANILNSLLT